MISDELRLIFHILAILSSLYIVIVSLGILLTWFGGGIHRGLTDFFTVAARPWLGLFSKIKSMRYRNIDLTPILAIIVLTLISRIFWQLAEVRFLSLAFVLIQLVNIVETTLNFVIIVFGALSALRLIGVLVNSSSISQMWLMVDHILQPFIYRFISKIMPRRNLPYGTALGLFFGAMVILWFAVFSLARLLYWAIQFITI